jgi:hypothetical protein
MARVLSGIDDRTLLVQNGTAGLQMRAVQEQEVEWPPHAVLIVHSDGIQSRWRLDDPAVLQRDPSLVAAFVFWKFCRGRDDATVVVVGRYDPPHPPDPPDRLPRHRPRRTPGRAGGAHPGSGGAARRA